MANEAPLEFFVERVANLSHANGVFRITFAQQAESDVVRPMVRLLIPANQLSPMLQGISKAARNIGEQVQARLSTTTDKADADVGSDDKRPTKRPAKK